MSSVELFWILVGALALVLLLISVREALLLWRMPKGHPDRGLYWFNILFLLIAAPLVICAGSYVDLGRRTLEEMIVVPPMSRYAIERNDIIHGTTWVYVSTMSEDEIISFYRAYASAQHVGLIEDDRDALRMSFALPSGNLFLTLAREGDRTVLYYSRAGEIRTVPSRS